MVYAIAKKWENGENGVIKWGSNLDYDIKPLTVFSIKWGSNLDYDIKPLTVFSTN